MVKSDWTILSIENFQIIQQDTVIFPAERVLGTTSGHDGHSCAERFEAPALNPPPSPRGKTRRWKHVRPSLFFININTFFINT